jgi:hypothetical protein
MEIFGPLAGHLKTAATALDWPIIQLAIVRELLSEDRVNLWDVDKRSGRPTRTSAADWSK